jgi:hypothetical protein
MNFKSQTHLKSNFLVLLFILKFEDKRSNKLLVAISLPKILDIKYKGDIQYLVPYIRYEINHLYLNSKIYLQNRVS